MFKVKTDSGQFVERPIAKAYDGIITFGRGPWLSRDNPIHIVRPKARRKFEWRRAATGQRYSAMSPMRAYETGQVGYHLVLKGVR